MMSIEPSNKETIHCMTVCDSIPSSSSPWPEVALLFSSRWHVCRAAACWLLTTRTAPKHIMSHLVVGENGFTNRSLYFAILQVRQACWCESYHDRLDIWYDYLHAVHGLQEWAIWLWQWAGLHVQMVRCVSWICYCTTLLRDCASWCPTAKAVFLSFDLNTMHGQTLLL